MLKNLFFRQLLNKNNRKVINSSLKYTRCLTSMASSNPYVSKPNKISIDKETSREFLAVFPDLVRDLTDAGRHTDIPEVNKWFAKVLQYNLPRGKRSRGIAVAVSYKALADQSQLTEENLKLANILGWCVEMLHSHLLMVDDIMDNSELRRGQPCWYRVEGVGMTAINDANMVENGIFTILKKYFSDKSYYITIVELFHDIALKTMFGQNLDMRSVINGKPQFNLYTMQRYEMIANYKTSYYSFHLPTALAMFLAGVNDIEVHRQARTIMLEIGEYFQIQDDYLDCYGNPDVMGKKCVDIQEGKCSWLAVVALQRSTPTQRKIFEENYGIKDEKSIATIKQLYDQLKLPHLFAKYEEETYNLIRTHIQQISRGLPHKMFFDILDRIFKRTR